MVGFASGVWYIHRFPTFISPAVHPTLCRTSATSYGENRGTLPVHITSLYLPQRGLLAHPKFRSGSVFGRRDLLGYPAVLIGDHAKNFICGHMRWYHQSRVGENFFPALVSYNSIRIIREVDLQDLYCSGRLNASDIFTARQHAVVVHLLV